MSHPCDNCPAESVVKSIVYCPQLNYHLYTQGCIKLYNMSPSKAKQTIEKHRKESKQEMLVLCCGSRYWKDEQTIFERLSKLPPDTIILHGDCRGADRLSAKIGKSLGFKIKAVKAKWKKYGDSAGPKRNKKMIQMNPDLVIAFHDNLNSSKGTIITVNLAEKAGIPVEKIKGNNA